MAHALARAKQAGVTRERLQEFFASADCSAVLTAHPTEVRRRSSIDREMEIARLLDERDRRQLTPEELDENRNALRRAILTLWQTSILRRERLRVIDEVVNGLAYYDHTFLRELSRFYGDLEDQLGMLRGSAGIRLKSFLRIGSWIGGDRDGNPFVTAEVLRETMRLQSERALAFYLSELHELGGNFLSMAAWWTYRTGCARWRSVHRTARRSVRMNPIAVPSLASMLGSRPPPGR
jgi:phosphoenolpyruvate carboxylase